LVIYSSAITMMHGPINISVRHVGIYIMALISGHSRGKAIPLQAWTGPEGSRRFMHADFNTVGT